MGPSAMGAPPVPAYGPFMADVDDAPVEERRYPTPTGEPCPRSLRLDGTVAGAAACHGCGYCLLLAGLVPPAG